MPKTYHVEKIGFVGTADELVHQLHKGSRAKAPDDQAWIKETANRIKMLDGSDIRDDNSEHFVEDLMSTGHINALTEN